MAKIKFWRFIQYIVFVTFVGALGGAMSFTLAYELNYLFYGSTIGADFPVWIRFLSLFGFMTFIMLSTSWYLRKWPVR